ncbi:MAG: hypothetical protein CMM30_09990 [Rhodospirillaceae bacterium]|nr:hypothetical protein [Rhodospirillaceae bacterium]|tara:strand:+ start:162 stop:827 length:666 start_codon:yes stop_codon:yes gene_type:complete
MFVKKTNKTNRDGKENPSYQGIKKTNRIDSPDIDSGVSKNNPANLDTSMIARGLSHKSNILRDLSISEKNLVTESRVVEIGNDVSLEGNIQGFQKLNVNGSFTGEINGNTVVIGSRGQVKGSVTAEYLEIKGDFSGEAEIEKHISIAKSGKVDASITYGTMEVEAGGEVNGKLVAINSDKESLNKIRQPCDGEELITFKGDSDLHLNLPSPMDNSIVMEAK